MEKQPDKQPNNKGTSHSEHRKVGRGQNPASQANLKPFEKGVSGNPGGRSQKNESFIEALREYGRRDYIDHWDIVNDHSNAEELVRNIWKEANSNNYQAIRLLLDLGVVELE